MSTFATDKAVPQLKEAAQLIAQGRREEGTLIYKEIAQRAGNDVALLIELGHFCLGVNALDQAIEHYLAAVEQEPHNAHYLGFLGVAYQRDERPEEAFDVLNRAIAINSEIPSVLNSLGLVYVTRSDFVQASEQFERAVALKPSEPSFRINYAMSLKQLNEHEEALKQAQKAVKRDPANPEAQYLVGRILTELGRNDDAIRHFEKIIRDHKTFGEAYDLLARIKKFTAADTPFIRRTEKVLKAGMPPEQRYAVHYALGKMHDDRKEWDQAFEHFRQANLLQKKPFDIEFERKRFVRTKKIFDESLLERFRAFGHSSAQPVFIVGMPRSGTTLMAQMIASHPRGASADELLEFPRIAELISPSDDLRRYASATRRNLTPENIRDYAEQYLRVLRQGREGADRIVDKLPGNLYYLGHISILFPNATIIHALRHPLDTCLSCYFQNFAVLRWANDLKVIAEVYRRQRDAMAHWQRLLPAGKIVEVQYERLIEEPETEGRRMIEACGLEWDESLLQFHRSESVVKTASLWQVRQPIYRTSRMRWKHYARHVGGLADALSDYLQQDREDLKAYGIDLAGASRMAWLKRLTG